MEKGEGKIPTYYYDDSPSVTDLIKPQSGQLRICQSIRGSSSEQSHLDYLSLVWFLFKSLIVISLFFSVNGSLQDDISAKTNISGLT